ncbi:MAG: extracellular solute-binding protein [Firmicutes bacterium]|nr:extracellular solute-binding protein [Bacillota bacterium]
MKNMKKFMALGLATAMTLSMAACGNGGSGDSQSGSQGNSGNQGNQGDSGNQGASVDTDKVFGPGDGHIEIGSWWVQYYDSANYADGDMNVNPDWVSAQDAEGDDEETAKQKAINRNVAQLKWDNVKTIEEKYGVKFTWENLTYEGTQDSINTSIIAGSPDCEVYLVESSMAIPAQMNGLAVDLKTILPADDDLFTDQSNMGYLDMGDGKACVLYQKSGQNNVEGTYPLGFNMQLLEENNLEDPRDLWERGEWTWDKFIEYCQVLTQDTDGDGQVDQYGYCGYEQETFEQLLMSNGASIASTTTESLSSAATGEALQMLYDMYNTYKSTDGYSICYPYDFDTTTNSDTMRIQYCQGNVGFFPIAVWIANGQNNYSPSTADNDYSAKNLTFDTAYVRWPVGYSGNKDTNPGKNAASGTSYFIIAAGSQNPGTAYYVLSDFFNWYHDDINVRDDKATLNWWYTENAYEPELQTENYEVMFDCGSHSTVDFWNALGVDYSTDTMNGIEALISGTMTPAQFQETFKQRVQDALDSTYGN